jgi:mannose/fructose-specific phosphotransferase system component IIA
MSEVLGVVVAHGNLASCLVEATESISGVEGALQPISNVGCSPELLIARIRDAIGRKPAILFVDLASGSCAHAARLAGREGAGISVVSGVNLPMLLDFVFHRDMDVCELSRRVVEKAHAGTVAYISDLPS